MKRKLSTSSAKTMDVLRLDPKEQQLKRLLLDAAASIDSTRSKEVVSGVNTVAKNDATKDKVVLRWAGGWVRDKLLGQQSHDIDVAINSMTGQDFARALKRFCKNKENVKAHGLRPDDIKNIYTVAKNPAKSKNLETASCTVFGLDVDFVNLRTEVYGDDSRNPEMEFGTPEEDARRRDATVNALFYNIHTETVEDFVGGLPDMQEKIIRTPLEPLQTFMDDPLRVLRLVRFASRLGFSIEANAKECMSDERVLQALKIKISRERIGVELEKMLKGKHPRDAVRYIDELGLYHTIFTDPARDDMPRPDLEAWKNAYELLHAQPADSVYGLLVTTDEERYLAWVLACMVPFAQVPNQADPALGINKKNPPLAAAAARQGFRAPNKVSDLAAGSWQNLKEITELKEVVRSKGERVDDRAYFGIAIRRWQGRGTHWRLQVLFAMLDNVMKTTRHISDPMETVGVIRGNWMDFIKHIQKLDLMDAPSIRPFVTGRMICEALGIKAGTWMAPVLTACMEWQLRNPQVTDSAEALKEVLSRKVELGIADLLPQ